MAKPYKGRIANWAKVEFTVPNGLEGPEPHLGYYIIGNFLDHVPAPGKLWHTSMVVHRDGDEIETFNSKYTLVDQKPTTE